MLSQSWHALRPHAIQRSLFTTRKRFPVVVAGRGSGKTELARRRIVRALAERKPGNSGPLYFYALPTVQQAKRVAWKPLCDLVPQEWLAGEPNKTDMVIETKFGSSLYVVGMDKPHRIEGVQWCGGILDECSDQKPGAFSTTILPALSRWRGFCWRIGVPKRFGVGALEFKEAYDEGNSGEKEEVASFHWKSGDIISPEELETARALLAEVDFNEQYCASWEKASGAVYHAFDEIFNVDSQVTYSESAEIVVGSDFNVSPMSWILAHKVGDEFQVFDFIQLNDTNTQATLDVLHKKYGAHTGGWLFTGDATGRARKTSAAFTDYALIYQDNRFSNKRVLYPRSNPAVVDRYAAVNALCCAANGKRRLKVHPRCKPLIRELAAASFKPQTREIDTQNGTVGHITDALGYPIAILFPIAIPKPAAAVSVSASA